MVIALDSSWDVANTNAWTFAESRCASVHLLAVFAVLDCDNQEQKEQSQDLAVITVIHCFSWSLPLWKFLV